MKIKSWQFRPHNIILITYSVVFIFWAFPSFDYFRKGFDQPLSLFSVGGLGLISALLSAWCMAYVFYNIGKILSCSKNRPTLLINEALSNRTYFLFILLSGIGLLAVFYSLVKSGGMYFILESVQSGQANQLKKALYEDYSVGVLSLRYASVMCGALLISRRMSGIKNTLLDLSALTLVLLTALLSSRLTVSASLFGGFYLYIHFKKEIKISSIRLLISATLIFLLFSALNWSRNYGFYEKMGLGFISGGFSEILAYLGTPFQGAIFAISNLGSDYSTSEMFNATTIETSLTTNSAFLELTSDNSWLGLIELYLLISASSLAIGFCERYKGGKFICCSVPLIYAFAELWRLSLFEKGLTITIIAISFFVAQLSQRKLISK
ncbi:hypothetical protein [Pseudomonas helleri]|uniref:hypothetical protein n=1 Tax=Pseudomonas helleri TaxID=1608996 RepID=UPI0021C71958|nr:hypothetical protein [Pseudomonas helleri]MCU1756084.1 hypothetical protein [Pseudomonas helleri]